MAQLNKKIIAVAVAVVFCVLASFWPQQREENVLELEQQAVQIEEAAAEAKITAARCQSRGCTRLRRAAAPLTR